MSEIKVREARKPENSSFSLSLFKPQSLVPDLLITSHIFLDFSNSNKSGIMLIDGWIINWDVIFLC